LGTVNKGLCSRLQLAAAHTGLLLRQSGPDLLSSLSALHERGRSSPSACIKSSRSSAIKLLCPHASAMLVPVIWRMWTELALCSLLPALQAIPPALVAHGSRVEWPVGLPESAVCTIGPPAVGALSEQHHSICGIDSAQTILGSSAARWSPWVSLRPSGGFGATATLRFAQFGFRSLHMQRGAQSDARARRTRCFALLMRS